jgi:hypothetical protein
MNTTHTTSEVERRIPYTVMGGARGDRVRRYPYPVTLLVLSRGDRLFRPELLRDLQGRGFGEILWVENAEPSPDVESLSHDFPDVRFLLLKAPSTIGERVNIGIAESRAPLVLVMWSDTRLSDFAPKALDLMEKSGALCSVPVALTPHQETLPSWQAPQWKRRRFVVAFRIPRRDGERVLFPFDFCGVYNRLKFSQSAGFDAKIANPYWQKLDFGMRCFLWGEKIQGTTGMSLTYTGSPPEEETTPDEGYKLFWLKNIAVRVRGEMGSLSGWRALEYMTRSDTGPLFAINEFRAVRAWVHTHRFRFRRESRDLIARWESL